MTQIIMSEDQREAARLFSDLAEEFDTRKIALHCQAGINLFNQFQALADLKLPSGASILVAVKDTMSMKEDGSEVLLIAPPGKASNDAAIRIHRTPEGKIVVQDGERFIDIPLQFNRVTGEFESTKTRVGPFGEFIPRESGLVVVSRVVTEVFRKKHSKPASV